MKSAALAYAFAAAVMAAQTGPRISNATLETKSAAPGLQQVFDAALRAQPGAVWIGWDVPSARVSNLACDWSERVSAPGPVHLEPPDRARILARAEGGTLLKLRVLSPDCELDAGGLPFYWLTDVRPEESVALLESLAAKRDRVGDGAVTAIAQHGGEAADRVLEKFVAADRPFSLREKAARWLGIARGRRGYETLKRLAASDPDDRMREKAMSALSQSPVPEALETLASAARSDKSSRVRSQALFWLARRPNGSSRALAVIQDALENDAETEVKKNAVQALSQLPDGQGIPRLIELARAGRNAEVRKQAMLWLGRSKDPRAVNFFEEVLKR